MAFLTWPYECSVRHASSSSARDEYGRPIGAAEPDVVGLECDVQQSTTKDEETGAVTVISDSWRLLLPAGSVVLEASSIVVVDGLGEFEVDGEPWNNPADLGALSAGLIEANLKRTR